MKRIITSAIVSAMTLISLGGCLLGVDVDDRDGRHHWDGRHHRDGSYDRDGRHDRDGHHDREGHHDRDQRDEERH